MRQMRLKKREVKDRKVLREILEECEVIRIASMDEEGIFIVPVNYGYEWKTDGENPRIYFHSAKEGRKADAFANRQEVSFEMDCRHGVITGDYSCSYSYSFRSIMGTGKIRLVTDQQEKRKGMSSLMKHLAPYASLEFSQEVMEKTNVYCIDVCTLTGKERKPKNIE